MPCINLKRIGRGNFRKCGKPPIPSNRTKGGRHGGPRVKAPTLNYLNSIFYPSDPINPAGQNKVTSETRRGIANYPRPLPLHDPPNGGVTSNNQGPGKDIKEGVQAAIQTRRGGRKAEAQSCPPNLGLTFRVRPDTPSRPICTPSKFGAQPVGNSGYCVTRKTVGENWRSLAGPDGPAHSLIRNLSRVFCAPSKFAVGMMQ